MDNNKQSLRILSLNLHKGFSTLNTRLIIHDLRDAIRCVSADIVFLQEVQGAHSKHSKREDWPDQPQYEFLADSVWSDFAYARNAVYPEGHHGNAILSKYPITGWENIDLSVLGRSRRGLLHCTIDIPWMADFHCLCVHLGLLEKERKSQLEQMREYIASNIPEEKPLVLAGDFNDWRKRAQKKLAAPLDLEEVFLSTTGKHAKSFPSRLPLIPLDRIYVRGCEIKKSEVIHQGVWGRLSDHVPLITEITIQLDDSTQNQEDFPSGSGRKLCKNHTQDDPLKK